MWTSAVHIYRRTPDAFLWNCLIVLTVAITCCESTFEWSCSTPVNDVAFFPDIPTDLSDPVIINSEGTIETGVGQLYIYPVPQDAQRCSGTVTGVQYCYRSGESVNFNLLIFNEPVDSTSPPRIQYSVNQVISITKNRSTCSGSVCCASSTFNADAQFQLETSAFTYGIETVLSIQGFSNTTDFRVSSYFLTAADLMNSMITINPSRASTNTLRIVKFIIDTSTTTAPPDSEMITANPTTTDNNIPTTDPPATDPSTTEATLGNTAATTSSPQIGGDSSLPAVVGAVIGVLVSAVLLMVGVVVLVVCICTKMRRSTDKGKPEVVSERQVVEDSQRGGISNGIHSAETDYEVIELDSQKQTTEMMSSNPSYMPNTDASINYEDDMYSYIDPEDVRILARNPIVGEQVPTADNVCYGHGLAIPQDHSDQVPTADNVAYVSTIQ